MLHTGGENVVYGGSGRRAGESPPPSVAWFLHAPICCFTPNPPPPWAEMRHRKRQVRQERLHRGQVEPNRGSLRPHGHDPEQDVQVKKRRVQGWLPQLFVIACPPPPLLLLCCCTAFISFRPLGSFDRSISREVPADCARSVWVKDVFVACA